MLKIRIRKFIYQSKKINEFLKIYTSRASDKIELKGNKQSWEVCSLLGSSKLKNYLQSCIG
jgi:hypothetical protein